jgi:Ca2+-binding EF-hand superfamily protein
MLFKTPDQNNDGKVDAEDVVAAAKEAVVDVKAEATEVVAKVKKARKKKKTA